MVKQNKDQPPTPAQAAATPAYRHVVDQDFAISILMELQKTVGAQEATLEHVSRDVTDLKKTVGRVEKVIIGATAVFIIGGAVLGWMVNTAKELYIATHAIEHPLPLPSHQEPRPNRNQASRFLRINLRRLKLNARS